MQVKDLIIKLQKLDPDKEVYLSRDEEGNGYGTLSEDITETSKAVVLFPAIEYVDEDLIFNEEEE
jgi:hypothetical protein